jgi:hypothetical protein
VLISAASAQSANQKHNGNGDGNGNIEDSRVQTGLAISPVPLSLAGKDRELVGIGSYLVNAVGGCNDCHTRPAYLAGGNPFVGEPTIINAADYLTGGRQFGPGVTSKNLTPDANGRPAGLTFEEFEQAIRTGRDPADNGIIQVMPWPMYKNMTDFDFRSIYEYLRSIPSKPDNPNPGP